MPSNRLSNPEKECQQEQDICNAKVEDKCIRYVPGVPLSEQSGQEQSIPRQTHSQHHRIQEREQGCCTIRELRLILILIVVIVFVGVIVFEQSITFHFKLHLCKNNNRKKNKNEAEALEWARDQ